MKNNLKSLKNLLDHQIYPNNYLFKFILKPDNQKISKILSFFDNDVKYKVKNSSNGSYVSISINLRVKNSQEVIAKYQKISTIKGIISL
tara:strand:+ start:91 stop:357 length:267 start_codon:yes stop_codon:yes gene_type:complete